MKLCFYDLSDYMEALHGLWSDKYIEALVNDGTCLLPLDHEGDHVFTPNNEFEVVLIGDNYEIRLRKPA